MCAKSTQTWKDLGIELLGADNNDALNVISHNNNDVMKCCSAMFQLWLDRQPTASWKKLIEALNQLQLNYAADQIKSKLILQESDAGLLRIRTCIVCPRGCHSHNYARGPQLH